MTTEYWIFLMASSLFLGVTWGASCYLQSPIWHRAWLLEGPPFSHSIFLAGSIWQDGALWLPLIKQCHIAESQKHAFSCSIICLLEWGCPQNSNGFHPYSIFSPSFWQGMTDAPFLLFCSLCVCFLYHHCTFVLFLFALCKFFQQL